MSIINSIGGNSGSSIPAFDDSQTQLGTNTYQGAIEVVDSRLDNAKLLQIPPSFTILLDGTAGNDVNDGFTTPIKTSDRLQEVLNSYDWNSQFVTVNCSNINTTNITIRGNSIIGIFYLIINGNTVNYTGNILLLNFNSFLVLNSFVLRGSATVTVQDCLEVFFSNEIDVNSSFNGNIFTITNTERVTFNGTNITINNNSAIVFFCSNVGRVAITGLVFESVIISTLILLINCRLLELENVFSGSMTGRQINALLSPYLAITKQNWNLTSTVPDDIFETHSLNGVDQRQPRYTQKITGLLATKTTDTTWSVSLGTGQIVDARTNPLIPVIRKINYLSNQSYPIPTQLNGTTVTSVYAYYFWNGTAIAIGYQTTAPIADELIDKLFLCAIISANGTIIDSVRPLHLPDEPATKALLNFGAVNVNNIFPQPIANTMRLSIAEQKLKFAGRWHHETPKTPNSKVFPAVTEISYLLCRPNGTIISNTPETNFNFNRYWSNNQLTTPSNSAYYTVQFLFRYPNGVFLSVLGVNEYVNLELAANYWRNIEPGRNPLILKNNAIFLCAIVGKASATNIANNNLISGDALIITD